jgi:hypothetical protein
MSPAAILQASIVFIVTFLVIYWVAIKLGLDKRLAATLGAGGAVCGVSAAIAIAGAVGAKKEDAPIAITTVIIWAIAMIFVLPFISMMFSRATTNSQRASSRTSGLLSDGMAAKSKVSKLFTAEKCAARMRRSRTSTRLSGLLSDGGRCHPVRSFDILRRRDGERQNSCRRSAGSHPPEEGFLWTLSIPTNHIGDQ